MDTISPSSSQVEPPAPGPAAAPPDPPEPGTTPTPGPAARSTRSALIAAALSFVFPGAGQLYLGRRTWAAFFAVPALAAIAWGIIQLSGGLVYFAVSMLDVDYALTVMAVAAAFTAWRVASIVHPFVVMRPRRVGRRAAAVLALLLVATLGMGDVVFSNALDAYSAAQQMASNDFADATASPSPLVLTPTPGPSQTIAPTESASAPPSAPASASASPLVTPSPTSPCGTSSAVRQVVSNEFADLAASPTPLTLTPVPDTSVEPTESGSPLPLATTQVTPSLVLTPTPGQSQTIAPTESAPAPPSAPASASASPSPTWSPADPNRLTVLLTGVDFMTGRSHALNDTIMLVSINLKTRAVAMVSVPRDTSDFPFYWGGQAPVTFKINSLVNAVAAGRFGSPDTPMVTLANEVGWLVGVRVNYYAEIDIDGFSKLIDLVGGVDINNPTLLNDPSTGTCIPAGPVHLDGTTALQYVRSRETTNDYARANRQQIVMIALEKKLATPAMLPMLGSLLALAGKSIATNFPLKTARNYVYTAQHLGSISQCVLGPPYNYHPDSSLTGGSWTSRLKLDEVADLSVQLFGTDSRYYGGSNVVPVPCQNRS